VEIRLDPVNVVVDDMEAMAAFYSRSDLRLSRGTPEWEPPEQRGTGWRGPDAVRTVGRRARN
jgi:hypothetical protein